MGLERNGRVSDVNKMSLVVASCTGVECSFSVLYCGGAKVEDLCEKCLGLM